MSAFQAQFERDPDFPDELYWNTDKPVFRDATVHYRPPFAEPNAGAEATVRVELDSGDPIVAVQENAWNTILVNSTVIEERLRQKLFAHHSVGYRAFVNELLEDLDEWELDEWNVMKDAIDWKSAAAIDHLYQLNCVTLFDHGPGDIGYCAFDFDSGWDDEHGVSILMHREQVLAGGHIAEFSNRGPLTKFLADLQSRQPRSPW